MHERTRQFQQTHIELAECVLKNNIFEHNTCFYKQLFTLHLIRICSENSFYDRRCNDLEVWLRGGDTVISWLDDKFLKPVNEKGRTFLMI